MKPKFYILVNFPAPHKAIDFTTEEETGDECLFLEPGANVMDPIFLQTT